MIKQFFSKMCGRSEKASNNSVLIKDFDAQEKSDNTSVVPLRGSHGNSEQAVSRKKEPVERFTESVDLLVDKLEGINDNLSRQTQQNERLVQKLDELPTLLSPVPDAVHQQRQALFQMADQLRRKLEQDEKITQLLSGLPEQTGRQTESLQAIQERLSTAAETDVKMSETFRQMSESLTKLDTGTAGQIEWLQKMSRSFADHEQLIKITLADQQRRFFKVFTVSVIIAAVAVTGLVIALVMMLYR